MRNLLIILLILGVQQCVKSQPYVIYWTGAGHTSYQVQQGRDSLNWNTIGTVNGTLATTNYQYTIPGPTYYYRIKANSDSSQAIMVAETLSIKKGGSSSGGHKKPKLIALSIKANTTGSDINYTILSPQPQQLIYMLYNVGGQLITKQTINLYTGTNIFKDTRPIVKGMYFGQFTGYLSEPITVKVNNY